MSDRETERRMLDAAVALVHERGLSTGLEALAFDEVIRSAEVSRTSAYRRWPKRDLFYSEVLLELAAGAVLPTPETSVAGAAADVVIAHADRLRNPQANRDLVVELLRVSIGADFEVVSTAPAWRTYRLLLASYEGITNLDVRDAVAAALSAAEKHALEARARIYAEFTALLGYRLVSPLAGPDGFELMSRAAGATMTGVLSRLSLGDASNQAPRQMRAFGATGPAEWTPATYMLTATVLSYIEPDPGVDWTPGRISDLITALKRFSNPAT